jgi:hypothetical protein
LKGKRSQETASGSVEVWVGLSSASEASGKQEL